MRLGQTDFERVGRAREGGLRPRQYRRALHYREPTSSQPPPRGEPAPLRSQALSAGRRDAARGHRRYTLYFILYTIGWSTRCSARLSAVYFILYTMGWSARSSARPPAVYFILHTMGWSTTCSARPPAVYFILYTMGWSTRCSARRRPRADPRLRRYALCFILILNGWLW